MPCVLCCIQKIWSSIQNNQDLFTLYSRIRLKVKTVILNIKTVLTEILANVIESKGGWDISFGKGEMRLSILPPNCIFIYSEAVFALFNRAACYSRNLTSCF